MLDGADAKGEPRSVPDSAGDQYDEMMRQERLKKQRLEDALTTASPLGVQLPLTSLQRAPGPYPFVKIGLQTYKGIDDGRANVLVPIDDPLVSPTEHAERRRAVARTLFMTDHPLGSAAYDLATLANTSPGVRDGALVAGGVADAAMTGAAPLGTQGRSGASGPKSESGPLGFQRPSVRDRGANAIGQAQGKDMTLTASMLVKGPSANRRVKPPDWQGNGRNFNESRGHLQAKQLGGSGRSISDLVTITQNPTNSSHMFSFENEIMRRVRDGEVMEYFVKPLYREGILPPRSVLMSAFGSRGAPIARLVENPAGRRR